MSEQHKQDNMPNTGNSLFSVGIQEKRNGKAEWGIIWKICTYMYTYIDR